MNDNRIELKEVENDFSKAKDIADKEGKAIIIAEDKVEYILVKNETTDILSKYTDEEIQKMVDEIIEEKAELLRRLS